MGHGLKESGRPAHIAHELPMPSGMPHFIGLLWAMAARGRHSLRERNASFHWPAMGHGLKESGRPAHIAHELPMPSGMPHFIGLLWAMAASPGQRPGSRVGMILRAEGPV